jgi:hypothetical protein
MTAIVDDLKTAAELIEKAADLVHQAAKETYLPSEAARQSVRLAMGLIRLKLFPLRRDLALLRATANRRKPRQAGNESRE